MENANNVIAIIPARGGSKRLPGKNVLPFNGLPMIAHSIKVAQESGLFKRIIVSTDSQEIADTAKEFGAEVPFFRESLADDMTPVSEATLLALQQAEKYFNESYDHVVQLMANCPLKTARNIQDIFASHLENKNSFTLSVFKFGWMNPWWALKVNQDGSGEKLFQNTFVRSQDLPDLYCPTGAIWCAQCQALKRDKSFYGIGHKFFEIPWQNAVDIDDKDDFDFAECVANFLSKKENR